MVSDEIKIEKLEARCARLTAERDALRERIALWETWARPVLTNMALENEGAIFARWPINHEPLRADAKHALEAIDAALTAGKEQP